MILRSDEDPSWFYVHEGRREGPFDRRGLIQALLARDAPEKILVWRSGLTHWMKAGEVQELRLELPPPIPRDAQSPEATASGEPPPVPAEGETRGSGSGVESDDDDEDDELDTPGMPASEGSGSDEDRHRRRRRRKRKHNEPAFNPRVLQLAALFLILALVVWLLLRRMNQFPEGSVIDHGRLEAPPTETTPRRTPPLVAEVSVRRPPPRRPPSSVRT